MGIPHTFHIRDELLGHLSVAVVIAVRVLPPGTEMNLVNVHRPVHESAGFPLRFVPVFVIPGKAVIHIVDLRSGFAAGLTVEGIRIGF